MGQRAVQAVMRQFDGRGPSTALTPRVLGHFGISDPQELVHEIYYREQRRKLVASLGAEIEAAAGEGDAVARQIVSEAAGELVTAVRSVAERLEMRGRQFPLVLAGSIFRIMPSLLSDVTARVAEVAPRSEPSLLDVEPAMGAVQLALAEARGGARIPTYV
jgi:N-acetylglucosamine kinase-like BadF-type ATPase